MSLLNAFRKSHLGRAIIEKVIWYKIRCDRGRRITTGEFHAPKTRFGARTTHGESERGLWGKLPA